MSDTAAETMHDYTYAQARVKGLEQQWIQEVTETELRRDFRYVKVSQKQLRASGDIAQDEVYIPRRIADANIRREMAPFVAYFTQSQRMAVFRPLDNMALAPDPLEQEFTRLTQYDGWQYPFFRVGDGAKTHGWAAIETLFVDGEEEGIPGNVKNRYVAHEDLWHAWDIEDIQEAPCVVVVYRATLGDLKDYVDEYGFDPEQTEMVEKKLESQQDKIETRVRLFKVYFRDREDGLIYCGWQSEHASGWLKSPYKLSFDIIDTDGEPEFETKYPIHELPFEISENAAITETKGRVHRDEPDQEACTQLVTSFVNKANRSAYLMLAPKNPTDDTAKKQTQIKIANGMYVSEPADQFKIDAPDVTVLGAIEMLTTQNANESGQVNFAVKNRKDSRKTATEVNAATQEGGMLSSVDVTVLSLFMKGILTLMWRIIRSQVLQGKIQSSLNNYRLYYDRKYTLLPAGDVDVVKRQQVAMAMKQDWPVVQTTAAAQVFLEDYFRICPYADKADKYIAAIEQGNQKDNLLRGMANALKALALDPTGKLKPDAVQFAPQLQELQQEYQTVMAPPGAQQEGQNAEQPEAAAA